MSTIKLMHGTSSSLLKLIKENGLIPPLYSNIKTNKETKSEDRIYLTSNVNYAKRFADLAVSKFGGEKIIITVKLDSNNLFIDEDVLTEYLDSDENGYYFANDEDESRYYTLEQINNLTGLDSLNIDEKCRYKGIIKPEMICHIEKC